MGTRDEEFLKRLLATFRIEAEEHLTAMTGRLLELERRAPAVDAADVETIFREAHSLKGAARAIGIAEIELLCQRLESIFARMKREPFVPLQHQFDTLHRSVDGMRQYLSAAEDAERERAKTTLMHLADEVLSISSSEQSDAHDAPIPHSETETIEARGTDSSSSFPDVVPSSGRELSVNERSRSSDTIRIATAKLDALLLQAESLVNAKLFTAMRVEEVASLHEKTHAWLREWKKFRAASQPLENRRMNLRAMGNSMRSSSGVRRTCSRSTPRSRRCTNA